MATRRVWLPVLANTLQYSCLENSLSDREAWQATVYSVTKSQTRPKRPCRHRCKTFFACGSSAPLRVVRVVKLLCLQGPWRGQVCRGMDCLRPGVMALSQSFFKPLVAGNQKASLASLSLQLHLFRHLEGSLAWGTTSLLLGSQAHQEFIFLNVKENYIYSSTVY